MSLWTRFLAALRAGGATERDLSGMGRRDFLRLLGATAAVAASAPVLEQLLWTPSESIIVPPLPTIAAIGDYTFKIGDVFTIAGCYVTNPKTSERRLQQWQCVQVPESGVYGLRKA